MIRTEYSFTFRDKESIYDFLHNKDMHEKFLLQILNDTPAFKGNLKYIPAINQSNGECDFYDAVTLKYYEATLLLNEKIVVGLKSDSAYLASDEFVHQVTDELVNMITSRLQKKIKKERIILFNIFPNVAPKFQGSLTDIIMSGPFEQLIFKLQEEKSKLIINKEIIIVSYNLDNSFYIKQLYPVNHFSTYYVNKYYKLGFPFSITKFNVTVTNDNEISAV